MEGEPLKAYKAFSNYRDQAPPRVISDTIYPNGGEIKRATLYSWSKKYDWIKRATKFDDWRNSQIYNKKAALLTKQSAQSKTAQYENLANKFRFFLDVAGDILVNKLINDPDYIEKQKLSIKDLAYVKDKLITAEKALYGEDYFQKTTSLGDINLKKLTLDEKFILKKLLDKASPESDAPELEDQDLYEDEDDISHKLH